MAGNGRNGQAYAIRPDGVQGTLRATSAEGDELARLAKPLSESAAELSAATGRSSPVSGAWAAFSQVQHVRLAGIDRLVDACVTQAAAAAAAYVRGDEDMARDAQAMAVEAAAGLPGWITARTRLVGGDG